jgi:hypothetical protein
MIYSHADMRAGDDSKGRLVDKAAALLGMEPVSECYGFFFLLADVSAVVII